MEELTEADLIQDFLLGKSLETFLPPPLGGEISKTSTAFLCCQLPWAPRWVFAVTCSAPEVLGCAEGIQPETYGTQWWGDRDWCVRPMQGQG